MAAPGNTAHHRHLDFRPGGRTGLGTDFLRRALADWSVDPVAGADVLLVGAELLSNAARHADGLRRLDLDLEAGVLRVAVTDSSPGLPRARPDPPGASGGYGLGIVDRLALDWGSLPAGNGKTVWARLPAPHDG
ncbi:hypothetical protein Kpho02_61740 [Kitasatospora phosalacinea]|uniref:Histidine kinase/HSP90-like ATPase domain-containing protein n=1 Tax=Kitasatospora phosalacinea TaxID=2065 RepID=A0A9W6V3P7_9ACTN|nr:ATP-binding protein [Kitasatospora phosalacinea]GLW73876.1 hypothetical protein Kpho02_61740 [Kitasatospora phosalacinea]